MGRWVAAACGLIALGTVACGGSATLRIYGQPVRIITTVHEHGPGCGHEMIWYDGHATYYVDGTWVFYAPGYHAWVAYEKPSGFFRREEVRIKGHVARSSAVPKTHPTASKAPPVEYDATKAPPK